MRDFIDLDIIESWERDISILDEIDDISDTIELGKLGINALSLDTEKEVVWVEVVNDDEGREGGFDTEGTCVLHSEHLYRNADELRMVFISDEGELLFPHDWDISPADFRHL